MKHARCLFIALSLVSEMASAAGENGPMTIVEITPGTLKVGAAVACSWEQYREILAQDPIETTVVLDVASNVETSIFIQAKEEAESLGFHRFAIAPLERRSEFFSSIPGPLFSGCPQQSGAQLRR